MYERNRGCGHEGDDHPQRIYTGELMMSDREEAKEEEEEEEE